MATQHDALADKVIKAFKASLTAEARDAISTAEFEKLRNMIREALSAELNAAADIVEQAVQRLRAQVDKPELEL